MTDNHDNSSSSIVLSEACIKGSIDQTLELIKASEDPKVTCSTPISWVDNEGQELKSPPIFIAIDYGHLDLVRELLKFYQPPLIDTVMDGDGEYSALSWAAFAGQFAIVKLLVEEGKAKVDDEPLQLAREYEHNDIAEYLAKHVDLYSNLGGDLDAIMDKACREGDGAKVKQLLSEDNYDISKWKDEEGKYLALSPMYMAVKFGHYEVIQIFADMGIQVDLPKDAELEGTKVEEVEPTADS